MIEKTTNNWITDRPPTKADADRAGYVWCMDSGRQKVVITDWADFSFDTSPAWMPRELPTPYVPPEPDTSLAASVGVVERYVNDEVTSLDFNKQVAPAIRAIIAAVKEREELAERLDKAESFLFAKSRGIGQGRNKGYDDDDLEAMFGPYLLQGEVKGLASREVRMLETVRDLKARIAELEAEAEATSEDVLCVPTTRKPLDETPDPGPVQSGEYVTKYAAKPSESKRREWWIYKDSELVCEAYCHKQTTMHPVKFHVIEVLPTDPTPAAIEEVAAELIRRSLATDINRNVFITNTEMAQLAKKLRGQG